MKHLFVSLFILFLFPSTSLATEPGCLDYQDFLHQVAEVYPDPELGPEGWYRDLVIKGTFAYSVVQYYASTNALQVFDLTESESPQYLGRAGLPNSWAPLHLAIWDHYVYIGGSDLKTVDVDDQDTPVVVDTSNLGDDVRDLAVKPGWLFAASGNDQVIVYNLANPAHPQQTGTINAPYFPRSLAIDGDKLLVGGSGGLAIYSVAIPSFPTLLSTLPLGGNVEAMSVEGNLLAATCADGTRLIDLEDSNSPQLLGMININTGVSVVLRDEVAWIGTSGTGHGTLARWDVADPTAPVLLGRNNCVGIPYGLVLALGNVYTASFADDYAWIYEAPLCVFAGQEPSAPPHLGQLGITPNYNQHHASGLREDILYVIEETQVDIVDLADPANPVLGDEINILGYGVFGHDGLVVGPNLLVQMWDLFNSRYWWELYSLQDPHHPQYIGEPEMTGPADAWGSFVYETTSSGVNVFESLPTAQLEFLGTLFPGVTAGRPVFYGNQAAFLFGNQEVLLARMDGPMEATELGRIPAPESGEWRQPLAMADGVLITRLRESDLWEIWDLSEPALPVLLFTHQASPQLEESSCRIKDGIMYLDGQNSLQVWDIKHPSEPELLGDWPHVSHPVQVHCHPDFLITQGLNGYITTLPYQCNELSAAPEPDPVGDGLTLRTLASPNPTTGTTRIRFNLAEAGAVELEVFDLRGRRVARIREEGLGTGEQHLAWNGKDASGKIAAAGVYLVQVRSGQQRGTVRVVLLR